MPLFGGSDNTDSNDTKSTDKRGAREDKKASKRDYRIEKMKAATAKALAVATKRKWLVFLIGAAIAAYFVLKGGGLSIFTKFFGGGG